MYQFIKRAVDIAGSLFGCIILSPFFLTIMLLIKMDSKGPVFFRQIRVGKNGELFKIYKFRTMVDKAEEMGPLISKGDDRRITGTGRFLRKYKLDELPQLFNVLSGKMSLVGPRPEVPRFVNTYRDQYEIILKIKPGMTDYASVKYKNENDILNGVENVEEKYIRDILPRKITYYEKYIREKNIAKDIKIIFRTIVEIFK